MSPEQRLWPEEYVGHLLRLVAAARTRADGASTTVLAVDGPSGSGKSTLADQLVAALEGTAALVRMEDLYPGWDGLEAATERLATEVLPPLLRGEPAEFARWDWTRDRYGPDRDVVPSKLVTIVEGVGSGTRAASSSISALVFVDAPEQVRHGRAMARDGEGYRPHWERWAAQERAYFARERPRDRAALTFLPGCVQGPGLR
ncbi:uridine kinase [Kineosporia rhizophila]|uniref:uridine kinase n=1 Tax=Kineosporia TaxID=49184 RepID=UPI001E2F44E8|nr:MULTISPECIES: uridine kinase [Kineosporia]MCE0540562.1 uridine kinase [Kineosporia rhizophila]GLY17283.1 adenylate kinase [Kineosporia sp. NBRC 101677]